MIRSTGMLMAGVTLAGFGTAAAVTALAASAQGSTATQANPPAHEPDRCASLAGMKVESGVVTGADRFAANAPIVGGVTAGAKASTSLCRVHLQLHPVPGSEINVEVWLPDSWNNKLLGLGGGGFNGSLSPEVAPHLSKAIGQGYAAVANDAGHAPAPSLENWAHGQPEKIVDFGYRGNHLAAVVAKQVTTAYYGNPAERSYFVGCSNGGRDGIMLASRYPADYDGIVAGAPALRYTEIVTQLIWYSEAAKALGPAANITAKQKLVHNAIVQKCDKLDGVEDGVLEDPRACRFDISVLQCRGAAGPSCLTAGEVSAFNRIYGGARLGNGHQIMPGPAFGSEGVPGNWAAWVTGPIPAMAGQEFYRWLVHGDPTWNVSNFQMDRDYAAARARTAPIINADNPDIGAFTRRGGKLIIYQGWDDPAITPGSTIQYYMDVERTIGAKAASQVKLFMVPGMMHCGGGPGATSFDMQATLEKWIEHREEPRRVIASKPDIPAGEPALTRPLCAWPETAHYKGSGSTRDAANFRCKKAR